MFKNVGTLNLSDGKYPADMFITTFDEASGVFRVCFYKDKAFVDSFNLKIGFDEHGVITDVDRWKMKCLDLAADLAAAELKEKE